MHAADEGHFAALSSQVIPRNGQLLENSSGLLDAEVKLEGAE